MTDGSPDDTELPEGKWLGSSESSCTWQGGRPAGDPRVLPSFLTGAQATGRGCVLVALFARAVASKVGMRRAPSPPTCPIPALPSHLSTFLPAMDVSLPGPDSAFSRSPPAAPAVETPRRHLKQLSLASSSPLAARPLPPSGFGSPNGTPRSPASRPPGSIGRRSGRQSSISYSPSIRNVAADEADVGSTSGRASPARGGFPPRSSSDGTPLDPIESGRSSSEFAGRIPLSDRNGRLPVGFSIGEKESGEAADVPSPLPSTGRARSRSSLSIGSNGSVGDRDSPGMPKEPLTLVEQCVPADPDELLTRSEQDVALTMVCLACCGRGSAHPFFRHATLLSDIARKESTILELRNALSLHEKELADLKAEWRDLAATNAAPGVSQPQPSVMEAAEGLLGADTVQSGKRLLSLVLGVSTDETDEKDKGSAPAANGSSPVPSPAAPAKTRKSMPGRSSSDLMRSLSGLEQVAEAPEEGISAEGSPAASEPALEEAPPSTSPPAVRSFAAGRPTHPRASAGKRLSLLSSTSSMSSQSSVDTQPWLHNDANTARVAEEEAEEAADGKEVKGLMSDLAGSTGGGGWGRKFGDLAAGLNSNEQCVERFLKIIVNRRRLTRQPPLAPFSFLQSKRASMSFASSLTSSWSSFGTISPLTLPPLSQKAQPPKSPSPLPRASPTSSSTSTPRKLQATKMRPISSATAPRQLTSPSNNSFPTGVSSSGGDFFSDTVDSQAKLQAPLAPSGGFPAARLPDPAASPTRTGAAPTAQVDASDDWNW